MIKLATILILSCFVVLALGDGFWSWPLERYITPTCSSNNGTNFCLGCGIAVICIPQGDNYAEIHGTCPTTLPCYDGECLANPLNVDCVCDEASTGISYMCDPVNPQYYVLCVGSDENFLACPDGQEFGCESNVCTTPPSTTTTTTTTTVPPPPCTEVGIFPDGCTDFLVCTMVGQPPTRYSCEDGEYFDPNIKNCVPNEPFNCTTASGTAGDYPDPYDCQRYYVCAGTTLVFTDCCPDGQFYNSQPGVSSCQPNNGECVNALECSPSAESSVFEIYRGNDKSKNYNSGSYFSL